MKKNIALTIALFFLGIPSGWAAQPPADDISEGISRLGMIFIYDHILVTLDADYRAAENRYRRMLPKKEAYSETLPGPVVVKFSKTNPAGEFKGLNDRLAPVFDFLLDGLEKLQAKESKAQAKRLVTELKNLKKAPENLAKLKETIKLSDRYFETTIISPSRQLALAQLAFVLRELEIQCLSMSLIQTALIIDDSKFEEGQQFPIGRLDTKVSVDSSGKQQILPVNVEDFYRRYATQLETLAKVLERENEYAFAGIARDHLKQMNRELGPDGTNELLPVLVASKVKDFRESVEDEFPDVRGYLALNESFRTLERFGRIVELFDPAFEKALANKEKSFVMEAGTVGLSSSIGANDKPENVEFLHTRIDLTVRFRMLATLISKFAERFKDDPAQKLKWAIPEAAFDRYASTRAFTPLDPDGYEVIKLMSDSLKRVLATLSGK